MGRGGERGGASAVPQEDLQGREICVNNVTTEFWAVLLFVSPAMETNLHRLPNVELWHGTVVRVSMSLSAITSGVFFCIKASIKRFGSYVTAGYLCK